MWGIVKKLIWDFMPGPEKTDKSDYFDQCFRIVMNFEGGGKLHEVAGDSGGLTKWGISSKANPDIDVSNLTEAMAKQIYRSRYWGRCGADTAQWPLCLILFDTAVNCGVATAKKWNTTPGISAKQRAFAILNKREEYYHNIIRRKPQQKKFLNGWLNRVTALRKICS